MIRRERTHTLLSIIDHFENFFLIPFDHLELSIYFQFALLDLNWPLFKI